MRERAVAVALEPSASFAELMEGVWAARFNGEVRLLCQHGRPVLALFEADTRVRLT